MNDPARMRNNFDALRLLAAFLVLVSHQFPLLGAFEPRPAAMGEISLGGIGVYILFVISGYLVMQSWKRDPHLLRFAARRLLRLWPALCVLLGLTVFVLGPWVTAWSLHDYFASPLTWEFWSTLRMKPRYFLPGVFEDLPYPRALNGSLWTIPLEVRCYFGLMIAGALGLLHWRLIVLGALVVVAIQHIGFQHAATNPHRDHLRELGLFFLAGMCLFLFGDRWSQRQMTWLGVATACAIVATLLGQVLLALLIALPIAVIVVGLASTPGLSQVGRWGDYGFSVQQTVV